MGDSEENKGADTLAWEKATADNNNHTSQPQTQAQTPSTSTSSKSQPAAQTSPEAPKVSVSLEQARIFLQDAQVQKETTERKAAFLRSKGISQSDIDELLKEDWIRAQSDASYFLLYLSVPKDKLLTWTSTDERNPRHQRIVIIGFVKGGCCDNNHNHPPQDERTTCAHHHLPRVYGRDAPGATANNHERRP